MVVHIILIYISVNSKSDPGGDSHILVAPGVGFSLLCLAPGGLPRGVLNQSKSSIILKKGFELVFLPGVGNSPIKKIARGGVVRLGID